MRTAPEDHQELLTTTGRMALALYPYLESRTDVPVKPHQILEIVIAAWKGSVRICGRLAMRNVW